MSEIPRLYGAPGVDYDPANYDIILKWYVMADGVAEARIPVEALTGFLRQVTSTVTYALEGAAQSIAMGDCDYCENFRLVEVPGTVGTKQVYCPECNVSGRSIPFANAPIIGPKVKEGFERE